MQWLAQRYVIVDRAILCVDDVGGNRVVCHPLTYFPSCKRPRVPVAGPVLNDPTIPVRVP
jgi:hypothetical protein